MRLWSGRIYKKGEKLPSKRVTAEENGVSVISVEHAYALLCDEGYVEARERSGFVVIFRKSDGFASPGAPNETISRPSVEHDYPDFPLSVFCTPF